MTAPIRAGGPRWAAVGVRTGTGALGAPRAPGSGLPLHHPRCQPCVALPAVVCGGWHHRRVTPVAAGPVVGLVSCAAGGVEQLRTGYVEPALARGWRVAVTLTPTAATWLRANGETEKLEALTGLSVRSEGRLPGEERPHPPAACWVVAPPPPPRWPVSRSACRRSGPDPGLRGDRRPNGSDRRLPVREHRLCRSPRLGRSPRRPPRGRRATDGRGGGGRGLRPGLASVSRGPVFADVSAGSRSRLSTGAACW